MSATGSIDQNVPPPKTVSVQFVEILQGIWDELHRLADTADGIEDHLDKLTGRDGPLYATNPVDGRSTMPALESISWRLSEIGTVLNITPEDVERLGLARPNPPDLEGVERALGDVASAAEALPSRIDEARALARRRAPRRPTTPPVAPPPGKPRSFADREARRHAGEPA